MSTPVARALEFTSPDFTFAHQSVVNLSPGADPSMWTAAVVQDLKSTEAFLGGVVDELQGRQAERALSPDEEAALDQAQEWKRQARQEREALEEREQLIACDGPSSGHIGNASTWTAICVDPDWCEVKGTPIAFDSFAEIDNPQLASPDVKAQGVPVFRLDDMHQGIQADAGEHVESLTSLDDGYVKFLSGSNSVYVNNLPVVRHASDVLLNCNAEGLGGTRGQLLTEEKSADPPPARPATEQPPPGQRTSARLEQLKRQEAALQERLIDVNGVDKVVRFEDLKKIIDGIQGTSGTWTDIAAQTTRGLLKAGTALGEGAIGLGKLVVSAAQRQTVTGMMLTGVQGQIAAENIALGNTTLGSAASATGNFALAIVVPPDAQQAWMRGDYVESGTNTLVNVATLGVGAAKGPGALRGGRAADDVAEAVPQRANNAAPSANANTPARGHPRGAAGAVHVSRATTTRNGYTYHFDANGRVSRVEGDLRLDKSQGRNQNSQRRAGGSDRLPDDQGGHYIGRRFGGPADDFNHFAQNRNFNNSAYKKLENNWERLINAGHSVRVEIIPNYVAGSARPTSITIRQWVNGARWPDIPFVNRPGG
jgi:hypothetical protein